MASLLFLVFVITLSVLLWRRGQGTAPSPTPTHTATPRPSRRRLWPLSRSERMALWLQEAAPSSAATLPPGAAAELTAWVVTLTPRELRMWERDTHAFCAKVGIELPWLWGRELNQDADLRAELTTMVLMYSLSYSRIRRAVPTFLAVKELQRWRASPKRSRQRRFGDDLYTALVRRGLISIDPALFLAPERRRRRATIATIKRLDTEQHDQVRATVALMLAGSEITPLPTPSQSAPQLPADTEEENKATDGDQLPALNPSTA